MQTNFLKIVCLFLFVCFGVVDFFEGVVLHTIWSGYLYKSIVTKCFCLRVEIGGCRTAQNID